MRGSGGGEERKEEISDVTLGQIWHSTKSTLRGVGDNILRGMYVSVVFYCIWTMYIIPSRGPGPLTESEYVEIGLWQQFRIMTPIVRVLLDPFRQLLTSYIWGMLAGWGLEAGREGLEIGRRVGQYLGLLESPPSGRRTFLEHVRKHDFRGIGGGESRFGVRTFLINKIMMFLKPVINILVDKIVSLTDDQLDDIDWFLSDLVSADKLDEFDEFLTKYKTMSLAKRKMWVAPNSVNELFRTILQKAFKNADRQVDRQVKKDYTERGCTCKADGEKGFNYLTRKSWCEIEDPEGHGLCVQASKHRCEGWDEEEDTCYGYYWDYKYESDDDEDEDDDDDEDEDEDFMLQTRL